MLKCPGHMAGMFGADRTERIHPVRYADLSCRSTDSRPGRGIRRGSDSYEMGWSGLFRQLAGKS